jgi:hypothetical protein
MAMCHTNLKNRMAISGIATSKNHIELPVRSETGFVILRAWANSGLDSTFGNVETGSFLVTTRGA